MEKDLDLIGYFPPLLPDELFYSGCARFSDCFQMPSERSVVETLFGNQDQYAIVDLPCGLTRFTQKLLPNYPLGVETIIDRHTLFPYFTSFFSLDQSSEIRSDMKSENGRSIHTRVGLMASTVPDPAFLKFCSKCISRDRQRYGNAYWHRIHQIPGVYICPDHNQPLIESQVRYRGNQPNYRFCSLENALAQMCQLSPIMIPAKYFNWLLRISHDAKILLAGATFREISRVKALYRDSLKKSGFVTTTGRIRRRFLLPQFIEFFPEDFLSFIGCQLENSIEENWLIRLLLRSNQTKHHPIRHQVMISFLGYSIRDFSNLYKSYPQETGQRQKSFSCQNPLCTAQGKTKAILTYSRWKNESIFQITCDCGFVYKVPALSSGDEKIRVLTYGAAWENELKMFWMDAKLSLRGLSKRLGVDPRTAKRHADRLGLSSERPGNRGGRKEILVGKRSISKHCLEKKRKLWSSMILNYPDLGVTALRQKDKGTYTWLYRHDREWLKSHSPKAKTIEPGKQRVNWKLRDHQISSVITQTVDDLRHLSGRPRRITRRAIGISLGKKALLEKHLCKLPKTAKSIAAVVESREDFAIRRIRWCLNHCLKHKQIMPRWKFIRFAGIARLLDRESVQLALDSAISQIESISQQGSSKRRGDL